MRPYSRRSLLPLRHASPYSLFSLVALTMNLTRSMCAARHIVDSRGATAAPPPPPATSSCARGYFVAKTFLQIAPFARAKLASSTWEGEGRHATQVPTGPHRRAKSAALESKCTC